MRFYDREKEIVELKRLDALADYNAQLTVLMGRRRTGKTTLMMHALEGKPYLYFFVGKKAEQLQCKGRSTPNSVVLYWKSISVSNMANMSV